MTSAAKATRARSRGRRDALARSMLLMALAGLVIAVAPTSAPAGTGHTAGERETAKAAKRPNIVLIVTDDQAVPTVRPDTMPALLNRLAAAGTSFTDAIVTTPLCCPARASMLTGQYGHNNGVLKNDYGQLRHKQSTLPVWLGRAGYRTIHVGKWLNVYRKAPGPVSRPAPGWDVWQTIIEPNRFYDYKFSANGRRARFGTRDRDYVTDVLNRKSARVARRSARRKRPFYLQLDHWAPHDGPGRGSGMCHGGHDPVPAPADENLFATEPLPRPPSFDEEDVSDKPSFIQHQGPVNIEAPEREYRCGLASLRAVDRGIEKLHRALRKAGELRKTVFIFTSDNGYLYGEHRVRFKVLPYEEALRVPLLVRLPPRLREGGPSVPEIDAPVANIDLAPTILDLAGASPCRKERRCRVMDGRSLLPLLQDAQASWPQDRALVVEYTGRHHGFSSCSYRGIRAPGRLYVQHTMVPDFTTGECEPITEIENYDLESDPFQLDNLYPATPGTPEAELQGELTSRLTGLRNCAGLAGRDPQQGGRPYCE